jgi:hypothetical protein
MDKLYIYGGIAVGGLIGAYIPVLLFKSNPIGFVSIICGAIGSLVGLWAGYKAMQNLGE